MKRICIFCNKEKSENEFNKEHIIPEVLGNHILIIDDVCIDCNSLLGTKIDVHLTDSFYLIGTRTKLNLKGKSGKKPHILANASNIVTQKTKRNVSLKYNKKTERYDFKIHPKVIEKEDGTVNVTASTKEELIDILNTRSKRSKGRPLTFEEIEEIENEIRFLKHPPNYEVEMFYDLNKIKLAFLKIAYEFLYLIIDSSNGIFDLEELRNHKTIERIRTELYSEIKGKNIKEIKESRNYWDVQILFDIQLEDIISKNNVELFKKKIKKLLGHDYWHYIGVINLSVNKEILIVIRLLNSITAFVIFKNIDIKYFGGLDIVIDSKSKKAILFKDEMITKLMCNMFYKKRR